MVTRRRAAGRALLWTAAGIGAAHAAFSLYWGLGGSRLLDTVGAGAVALRAESPVLAGAGLIAIGVVKIVAAFVPVLVEYGRLGARRFWRAVSWVGGIGLALYGFVYSAIAMLVLAGPLAPDDGYDEPGMVGHAFIWDPLFFAWGAALVISLALTRDGASPHRNGSMSDDGDCESG